MIDPLDSDIEKALNKNVDDLYVTLARISEASSPQITLTSTSAALAVDVSPQALWNWLKEAGKKLFDSIWPTVKSIACEAYKEETELDKDWIKAVVTSILAAINITAAIAILVVTIAVKYGLGKLCPGK